jgi:YVTN family beta-propeller protein
MTLVVAFLLILGGLPFGVTETRAAVFNRPTYSSPIAISQDNNLVWVVNPEDDSVSVIRTDTNVVITKIAVGDEPQSVALDPNNTFAYVANAAGTTVTVIKITNAAPATFAAAVDTTVGPGGALTTGSEPWNLVISPDGNRVFVANSGQDTITVIDATTRTIIGNVDLQNSVCNDPDRNRHFQPRGLAVTQDSTKLYVTRFLSFTAAGGTQGTDGGKEGVVCRLDINTASPAIGSYAPAARIALAPRVTGFKIDATLPPDGVLDDTTAYPNQLQSIVIRGNRAYLPNIASSPSGPLRFNVDTHAFLNFVDGVTGGSQSDGGVLNLHLFARDPEPTKTRLFFANPWAVAFSNQSGAGNAYVVSAGSDLLVKLNVDAAGTVTPTVDGDTTRYIDLHDPAQAATSGDNAAKNPLGIVINESTTTAYTMNRVSRNVSVVNLGVDIVTKVIQTTSLPLPGSTEERVLVGAEMFFSSRGVFDRPAGTTVSTNDRLSSEGWQNCASCHFQGLTDGTVWAFGTGPRKSVPLNGSFAPHNGTDQRVLNYSAIFDEIQDFEANIRNVSGPGALAAPINGTTNDPNHGLLIGDDGNINNAPPTINAFALPNAKRRQVTVTLPGGSAVPALDSLESWVREAVRSPRGRLTTSQLTAGGGSPTGGLNPSDVSAGQALFLAAGCNTCHGGDKWTISQKDFNSPPAAGEIFTEVSPAAVTGNPVNNQYLNRFLRDIGSYNLGVPGQNNPIANNVGAVEKATNGQDGLGFDFNNDGRGTGFNVPSLLSTFSLPPYYHNGSCETLACVIGNVRHRTANNTRTDILQNPADQAKLVAFLQTIDANTTLTTAPCGRQARVTTSVAKTGDGRLSVTLTAVSAPSSANALQAITWRTLTNATVNLQGVGNVAQGDRTSLPNGTTSATFIVSRILNNGSTLVAFTATDSCGDFASFVGGGPGSF